ncbi:ficolin-1 isoform X2 [Patella vulgata]|uniref:ficolin-1 isoform X2 n=1 Tax=Patella vulgata TaxID=6465 RepID=UPI0021807AA6|nr:ficolin-1 isoform X2 [Patella vulgata]
MDHYMKTSRKTDSLIECGKFCSSIDDCRRFMFDKETNFCSVFESGENCITDEKIANKVCYRQESTCNEVNCTRCPIGYYGDQCQHIIQDCSDGYTGSVAPVKNLLSYIQPSIHGPILEVKCTFNCGGVTYIQYRKLNCRELDFNRTMDEYANGFGYIHGSYWLGLEHVYNILHNGNQFALEVVYVFNDKLMSPARGYYYDFNISNRSDNYRIDIKSYVEYTAKSIGDSLTQSGYNINGRPFSTYDQDFSNYDCPGRFHGGWWYLDDQVCSRANINGQRYGTTFESSWHWLDNLGNRTLFYDTQLKLRQK